MENKLQIVTELDNARTALVNAKDDFERIQIRDQAKALEACAAVLKRKDIEVDAADLVFCAERSIYKSDLKKRRKEWRENRDGISKLRELDKKYGTIPGDILGQWLEQDKKCGICRREMHWEDLCVDHDHATLAFRGLLCRQCNSGLGFFKDRIESLQNAIIYLQKYGQQTRNY